MTNLPDLNGEVFKNDNTRITIETIGKSLKPLALDTVDAIVVTIERADQTILLEKTLGDISVVANGRGQNSWLQFMIRGATDLAAIPAGIYKLRTVVTIGGNPVTLQNPDGSIGTFTVKA